MNERIRELEDQASQYASRETTDLDEWEFIFRKKFAELIVQECLSILETEIELVKGYKSTACNDFDVRWHEGKIEHFAKLVEKSKEHFGVEE
jgi:hypothetical protein